MILQKRMLMLIMILSKRKVMLIMISSKRMLKLIMIWSKRKVMLIMISSKRKVWVPFVCITSDLNIPPSIQMPAARRSKIMPTTQITLAKEYYHPHHEEEKGEETSNHSFTSHGNLPASRLQNLFQTFFGELFWEFVCERGNSQSLLFPLWQPGNLQSFQTDPKKWWQQKVGQTTNILQNTIFHFLGNICGYDCFGLNLWKHTN